MRTRHAVQLFGGLRAHTPRRIGDGVGEIESPAVRPVTERFDLGDAREALFQ